MADKLRGGSTVGGNIIWHAGNSNSALADWTANNIIATSVSATTFTGALSGNATTASSITGQGALATLSAVNAATITDNSVGAAELNVSGNGTTAQYLRSDADGTFTWATPTNTVYTLPEATATVRGGIELFSDTDNTVAANAVTTTASRTYGLQLNSSGQGVINVPWVDTNTVYTHPTTTGNKHIPSGGASGQFLKWSADGTAVWAADNNTVYTHPTTDGNKHVPATSTTNSGKVLTAGATAGSLSWATPTVGTVTSVTAGNGMTQSGTSSVNPTLNVVSHAGTAGTIGTINVGADALGVNLGTTSTTAARGDHSHTIAWTAGTTAGPTLSVAGGTAVAIPVANNTTASGVVTTGTQTFGGAKTFSSTIKASGDIIVNGGDVYPTSQAAGTAGRALKVRSGHTTADATARNIAGGNITVQSGQSVGTSTSSIIFQTPTPVGAAGTTLNALATRLTLASTGATFTGTVTATTFSGALSGNAVSATKLATARTLALSGDVTGSVTFDGSANATITAVVVDDSQAILKGTSAAYGGAKFALSGTTLTITTV
jgi:hypothetical protein